MTAALTALDDGDLEHLASAIEAGRLSPPFTTHAVARVIGSNAPTVALDLGGLAETTGNVASVLRLLVADRRGRTVDSPRLQLVTTTPQLAGVPTRDTSVVVRELFGLAEASVLVVGYAVRQGQEVFRALAERMESHPELAVRMCVDVRRDGQKLADSEILRRYVDDFRENQWPGDRLPQLYFDPRALRQVPGERASLHAKCLVIDEQAAFVSSANFTRAAQEKHIEVGVLIRSEPIARQLSMHFGSLIDSGVLQRLHVPGNS